MKRPPRDPTPQQLKFAEARVSGASLVDAFVAAYPPRGSRSREGERVKAKRLAKNPTVIWAMQQAAERQADEKAIENPDRMRKECLLALRRIRQGRLDCSYARAVLAELREANREIDRREEQARERQRVERAANRQLVKAFELMRMGGGERASGNPAPPAPSLDSAALPPIAPPMLEHIPAPTPRTTPSKEPDDELQQYVQAQQADRNAAVRKKSPEREVAYLPGHFPPRLAWAGGDPPHAPVPTLPTFSGCRTGIEAPALMAFREPWRTATEAIDGRKQKKPRGRYY
jgi:hypothetical protein